MPHTHTLKCTEATDILTQSNVRTDISSARQTIGQTPRLRSERRTIFRTTTAIACSGCYSVIKFFQTTMQANKSVSQISFSVYKIVFLLLFTNIHYKYKCIYNCVYYTWEFMMVYTHTHIFRVACNSFMSFAKEGGKVKTNVMRTIATCCNNR